MNTTNPRRIAAIFPGFGVGGAQVRYAALASHFADQTHHIILSLNGDTACREKLAPSVQAEYPPANHPKGQMLAAIRHAARTLRALAPDIVLTSNWGAMEWAIGARLAGLPHIHSEDGFGPEERTRQIPRRVWTRRLALRGSQIILPSQNLLRIATHQWRLPAARLHYIPNGIDLARFTNATPTALPQGQGLIIGTIAALRPEKNISRLLRAVARLSQPARLVIVGDGPERPALETLAAQLGIAPRVHFAGHSQQAECYLAAFHIFALSSDTEQMPISLLEAMATGLPAISTNVGDVRTMLAPENAPYVTNITDDAFARGLQNLLTADLPAIGQANRRVAQQNFDQTTMFNRWAHQLRLKIE